MNCATHPEVQAKGVCTRCSKPLCASCLKVVEGKTYCSSCGEYVRQLLEERHAARAAGPAGGDPAAARPAPAPTPIEPTVGNFGRGVAFAAGAGVLSALLWYASVVLTDYKLGLVAVGVGFLVGLAAFIGNGKQPSVQLALASVAVALASMLAGEYLIVNHVFRKVVGTFSPEGGSGWISFDLFFRAYKETLSPMDFVFYAIGAYEAFKLPAAGKPA